MNAHVPNVRRNLTLGNDLLERETERHVLALDIAWVHPDPEQPRKHFDAQALADLAQSIKAHGLLQPIVVRLPDPRQRENYVIVAGERRWRASKLAGLEVIDALELTKGDPAELALIENLQRENLTPLEEAIALERLKQSHNYSLETLASVVGKSKSTVSETIAIARLPAAILDEVRPAERAVPKSTLIELVRLGDSGKQMQLWQQIKAGATRQQIRRIKADRAPKKKRKGDLLVLLKSGRRFVNELNTISAAQLADSDIDQLRDLKRALITRLDEIEGARTRDAAK